MSGVGCRAGLVAVIRAGEVLNYIVTIEIIFVNSTGVDVAHCVHRNARGRLGLRKKWYCGLLELKWRENGRRASGNQIATRTFGKILNESMETRVTGLKLTLLRIPPKLIFELPYAVDTTVV